MTITLVALRVMPSQLTSGRSAWSNAWIGLVADVGGEDEAARWPAVTCSRLARLLRISRMST